MSRPALYPTLPCLAPYSTLHRILSSLPCTLLHPASYLTPHLPCTLLHVPTVTPPCIVLTVTPPCIVFFSPCLVPYSSLFVSYSTCFVPYYLLKLTPPCLVPNSTLPCTGLANQRSVSTKPNVEPLIVVVTQLHPALYQGTYKISYKRPACSLLHPRLQNTFCSTTLTVWKSFLSRNCGPCDIASHFTSVAPSGEQGWSSSQSISPPKLSHVAFGGSSRPLQTSETKSDFILNVFLCFVSITYLQKNH